MRDGNLKDILDYSINSTNRTKTSYFSRHVCSTNILVDSNHLMMAQSLVDKLVDMSHNLETLVS